MQRYRVTYTICIIAATFSSFFKAKIRNRIVSAIKYKLQMYFLNKYKKRIKIQKGREDKDKGNREREA